MNTAALFDEMAEILGEATRELKAARRMRAMKTKASGQKALPKPEGKTSDGKGKNLPSRVARRLEKKQAAKDAKKKESEKKGAPKAPAKKSAKKAEPKAPGRSAGSGGKEHSPFKRKSVLGPTKAHLLRNRNPSPWRTRAVGESLEEAAQASTDSKAPFSTRTVKKKNYWDCNKIAAYKQMCKGRGGERMKVTIKRSYKKAYNKARKRWERVLRHHTKRYPKGKYAQRAAR